jgi:hypothetical protein
VEELPTGDELEVRQVRAISETVKRVAMVRRGGGEEALPEEEQPLPEQEARGRASRRQAQARMEAELDAAMREPLEAREHAAGTRR